ncbi:MAG TPA: PASTA domain-containing protein [Actinomycetota bacterium]|nr:PASTA domain-containing protein [Actinomycetota bacterium]
MISRAAGLVLFLLTACTPEPRVFSDDPVTVPSVVGADVSDAREDLTDMGFLVRAVDEVTGEEVDCPDGTVADQDPSGDEEVLKASTITLTVRGCR